MASTYTPNNLIAGHFPIASDLVEIPSSYTVGGLSRGSVLGEISTGGKFRLSLSASDDGSQTPKAILAEDIAEIPVSYSNPTYATAPAYFTGEFNKDALNIGTGHTAASIKSGLRDRNIYLRTLAGRS